MILLWQHVVWWVGSSVLEEHTASILKVNIGTYDQIVQCHNPENHSINVLDWIWGGPYLTCSYSTCR